MNRPQRAILTPFFTVLLILVTSHLAQAADEFPGVRALMSEAEFVTTGLEKLSPAELEALDAWLLRYTAGDAELLQEMNTEVRAAQEAFEIVSRIEGDFTGWSGNTVFTLANGQVWQQRLRGRYLYEGPPNPEVRIDRNRLGFYRLTVVETGRRVGVSLRE